MKTWKCKKKFETKWLHHSHVILDENNFLDNIKYKIINERPWIPSAFVRNINPPFDSKVLSHVSSVLNIISDIRTVFSQFFRNQHPQKHPISAIRQTIVTSAAAIQEIQSLCEKQQHALFYSNKKWSKLN